MSTILTAHWIVGLLVVAASLTLVWRLPGRRITLYVLTLQILLGVLALKSGLRVPPVHWILALIAWGLYMAANAMGRRPGKERVAQVLAVIATVLILGTYGIGQHAVAHPSVMR